MRGSTVALRPATVQRGVIVGGQNIHPSITALGAFFHIHIHNTQSKLTRPSGNWQDLVITGKT